MSYFGPFLEPTPDNLSIWEWLFEKNNAVLSNNHGFRDASTGELLSHRALRDSTAAVSSSLHHSYGLQPLQTVAIVSRNALTYPIALMAASRLGAIVTALPPEAREEDLVYFFQQSFAVIVFTDAEAWERVKNAARKAQINAAHVIVLDETRDAGESTLEQLMSGGASHQPIKAWTPPEGGKSTCAFLAFTSGTTGKPKAVMISHANIISQLRQMRQLGSVSNASTVLGILPFYHITGLVHLLHLPLVLGQDLIIMRTFDMRDMMETIVKYRCTELWLVPPLLVRLLHDKTAQNYDLSFVEQFNTGAAPLTQEVINQLGVRFPRVRVRQAWGMTETTSCLTVTPSGLMTWENASKVGRLVPGTEIRVVDPETGKAVPHGQHGELWAKGPQVTVGYLNRPAETAASYVADGFLRTGDIGAIDENGFVTISDRIKEMIKVRGHAVAPAELEDLLLGHQSVVDAAVIGIPHDYSGEVPRAFIVLREGAEEESGYARIEKELRDLVQTKKAKHKRLTGGVEFLTEIPKSASGKILRRVLKDHWMETCREKAGEKSKL